jgi:hypothetical protein
MAVGEVMSWRAVGEGGEVSDLSYAGSHPAMKGPNTSQTAPTVRTPINENREFAKAWLTVAFVVAGFGVAVAISFGILRLHGPW